MYYLQLTRVPLVILLAIVVITQVIIPLFKGTKLFPIFSGRRNKLNKEIVNTREDIDIQHEQEDLDALKKSSTNQGVK